MWIDVGNLIRQHLPDKNGNTLPEDLTTGSCEIRDLTNHAIGTLFEGKVIYDKTYGHVTYGCAACYGWTDPISLWYDPVSVIITGLQQDGVFAWYPCESETDDVSSTFYSHWSSGAPTIATVDYYGSHTGVAVGSTASATYGFLQSNNAKNLCPAARKAPSGGDNVTPKIKIDSLAPNPIPTGSTANAKVTIDPPLTVTLTIASTGSGSATFGTSGHTTIQVPESTTVNITAGNLSSNGAADLTLSASYQGQTFDWTTFSVASGACTALYSGHSGDGSENCPSQVHLNDQWNFTNYCGSCQISCTAVAYDGTFSPASCGASSIAGVQGSGNQTITVTLLGNFTAQDCNWHLRSNPNGGRERSGRFNQIYGSIFRPQMQQGSQPIPLFLKLDFLKVVERIMATKLGKAVGLIMQLTLACFSGAAVGAQGAPPPRITEIAPSSGPTTPGIKIVVYGTDLPQDATIYFSGVQAREVRFISATKLEVTTPYLRPGSYELELGSAKEILQSTVQFSASPTPIDATIDSAIGLARQHKASQALAILTQIASQNDDFQVRARAHYEAAEIYFSLGDWWHWAGEAGAIFQEAAGPAVQTFWKYRLASSESDYVLPTSNQPDHDLVLADWVVKKDVTGNPEPRFHRSLVNARYGNLDKARADCNYILRVDPTNASYRALSAYINVLKGDHEGLRSFDHETITDPRALALLGEAEFLSGNTVDARAWWGEEAKLFPKRGSLALWLAKKHLIRGQNRIARSLLAECVAIDPASQEAKEATALLAASDESKP